MTQPGRIEVRDVPAPKPGPGEVLLRIRRIGICGSDIHVWHGKHPFTSYPVVQGHEYSATVEAVGPGVTGVRPGMKATARPQIVCGQCPPCRRGEYNVCNALKVQGFQGRLRQDLFVVPGNRLVPLPDGMSSITGRWWSPWPWPHGRPAGQAICGGSTSWS